MKRSPGSAGSESQVLQRIQRHLLPSSRPSQWLRRNNTSPTEEKVAVAPGTYSWHERMTYGVRRSMTRKRNCRCNAPMVSYLPWQEVQTSPVRTLPVASRFCGRLVPIHRDAPCRPKPSPIPEYGITSRAHAGSAGRSTGNGCGAHSVISWRLKSHPHIRLRAWRALDRRPDLHEVPTACTFGVAHALRLAGSGPVAAETPQDRTRRFQDFSAPQEEMAQAGRYSQYHVPRDRHVQSSDDPDVPRSDCRVWTLYVVTLHHQTTVASTKRMS